MDMRKNSDFAFDPHEGLFLLLDPHTDASSPYETTRPHTFSNAIVSVTVPYGTRTDLASIPRPLVWIFGYAGRHQRGCLFHDALYQEQPCDRIVADALMLAIHRYDRVSFFRRWSIYLAVRAFGWLAWAKHKNGVDTDY